jgi:hypothetical protein
MVVLGVLLMLAACSQIALTLREVEDVISLLQKPGANVKTRRASSFSMQPIAFFQEETPKSRSNKGTCSEGDQVLADRNCSAFTDEEMDEPLSKWPYLTRWCKIIASHGGANMQMDTCMAQECIANEHPAGAAQLWWQGRANNSAYLAVDYGFQMMEARYCKSSSFCSSDYGLNKSSTLQDMESHCDKHHPKWKSLTARDWLHWLNPLEGFSAADLQQRAVPLACAWGTLHCDATRCQKYLCSDEWTQKLSSEPPIS